MNEAEYILSLQSERDQLHKVLEELTTAVERQCRYDSVLRKSLAPYCKAARALLQETKDAR